MGQQVLTKEERDRERQSKIQRAIGYVNPYVGLKALVKPFTAGRLWKLGAALMSKPENRKTLLGKVFTPPKGFKGFYQGFSSKTASMGAGYLLGRSMGLGNLPSLGIGAGATLLSARLSSDKTARGLQGLIKDFTKSPAAGKITDAISESQAMNWGKKWGSKVAGIGAKAASFGMWASMGISAVKAGISGFMSLSEGFNESLKQVMRKDFGTGIAVNTRQANTERQRAIAAIQNTNLDVRRIIGNEASMMHYSG